MTITIDPKIRALLDKPHNIWKMPEITRLNFLKDKVSDGVYLREDEVREIKRLVLKYNGNKITTNKISSTTNSIREGKEVFI